MPMYHVHVPDMVLPACNPSFIEVEAGDSLGSVASQPRMTTKLQAPCKTVSKNKIINKNQN